LNKKLLLIIFAVSGLTALIYEMIWIRPLTLVFGATIYAVELGELHFIDIDGDKRHDHGNDGTNGGEITRGEPTICLKIQNLHPRDI